MHPLKVYSKNFGFKRVECLMNPETKVEKINFQHHEQCPSAAFCISEYRPIVGLLPRTCKFGNQVGVPGIESL
jgi:hypothetical protein